MAGFGFASVSAAIATDTAALCCLLLLLLSCHTITAAAVLLCVYNSQCCVFHLQSVPFIVLHKDELGCGFSRISSRQRHISRLSSMSFINLRKRKGKKNYMYIIEKWI